MFVFVGLGSNLGDRAAHLRAGIGRFAQLASPSGVAQSPVYETAPLYFTDQPPFFNMVIGGAVMVKPLELLTLFKQFEGELGRDLGMNAPRNGPRPLDLDILLAYAGMRWRPNAPPVIVDTPELSVPHPKIAERAFVLYPLRDLAPDLLHPLLHRTIAELAEDVQGQALRKLGMLASVR